MSEVININGDQYTEDDFNDEQKYLLRQIRSCKARVEQLTFDLDQVKVSEQAFSQLFMVSVEASKTKDDDVIEFGESDTPDTKEVKSEVG